MLFLRLNLSADFGYHFFEELFTLLTIFCVDGMDFALAVGVSRRIASFKEVVVDFINSAGA